MDKQAYQREYRKKHKQVNIVLSMEEYQTLKSAAQKECRSLSAVVRSFALCYATSSYYVPAAFLARFDTLNLSIHEVASHLNTFALQDQQFHSLIHNAHILPTLKKLMDDVNTFLIGGGK